MRILLIISKIFGTKKQSKFPERINLKLHPVWINIEGSML